MKREKELENEELRQQELEEAWIHQMSYDQIPYRPIPNRTREFQKQRQCQEDEEGQVRDEGSYLHPLLMVLQNYNRSSSLSAFKHFRDWQNDINFDHDPSCYSKILSILGEDSKWLYMNLILETAIPAGLDLEKLFAFIVYIYDVQNGYTQHSVSKVIMHSLLDLITTRKLPYTNGS
ncbi:hypothetical protein A2U01_0030634 [Trifolium medium]|uniref:Uncharacterized protein n=1 Tax=Trifolium medium TaxID=97028 RepID=A0A392PBS4_9FABA|nr:hypothetical protein [Trifolium medium]